MTNESLHILDRFPSQSHLITYHMAIDPDFYDLCHDYEACVKALRFWIASNDPNASARLNEYRVLVTDLELDIVKELKTLRHKQ